MFMNKNVIIGAIKDYNFFLIEPFFKTCRKFMPNIEIVIFYENLSKKTLSKLIGFNIKLVKMDNESYKKNLTINEYRYCFYKDFLLKNKHKYDNILLTDIRDVIFQGDIFSYKYKEPLNFFLENKKIEECPFNSKWILGLVGKEGWLKIKKEIISCSGTTIGKEDKIINYLETLINIVKKSRIQGSDQGAHNIIIYFKKIRDPYLFKNFDGPIATCGYSKKKIKFDKKNNLLGKDDKKIPLVHQYDRIPSLFKKYSSSKMKAYYLKIKLKKFIKLKLKTLFNISI